VHLVVDFDPAVPLDDLFAAGVLRDERAPRSVERAPLGEDDLRALRDLASLATAGNLDAIANFLGVLHFERRTSCADVYARLLEIAHGSGSAAVTERAAWLRNAYLGSPEERAGLLA
jgi:hypothetical protein